MELSRLNWIAGYICGIADDVLRDLYVRGKYRDVILPMTVLRRFGDIKWDDADRVHKLITEEIPERVAADTAYKNAQKNSDRQNARIEHGKALRRVMTALMKDDTELFKRFVDNDSFKRWMTNTVFGLTYGQSGI